MKSDAQVQATCQSCGSKFTVEQEYLERLPQVLCQGCYRKKAVNEPSPTPAVGAPLVTVFETAMAFNCTLNQLPPNIRFPREFKKMVRDMFRDIKEL